MDTGFLDTGLIGAIAATVWFFQRYGQLEADYSDIGPAAARLRVLALVLAAAAIPLASGLVFVVVIAMLSGPSLGGFDGPTWYVGSLAAMLVLVVVVELAGLAYRLRAGLEQRAIYRPQALPASASGAAAASVRAPASFSRIRADLPERSRR